MNGYTPAIWPEVEVPHDWKDCAKCELALQRKRMIWGEGNPAAGIYVLLDNPGARETPEGEAYLCGTRETLQRGAYEAGFKPEELFVTYLLKCRPIRAYNKETARSSCLPYLEDQLEAGKPRILFCMGNVAVQAFLGDSEAEVKQLRGRVHRVRDQPVGVTYHPLAVRRRPNLYPLFLQDWKLIREFAENLT